METIAKPEMLAQLYSLRAGMSVISEYSDVVKEYETKIAEYDTERKKKHKEIPRLRKKTKNEIEWRESQIVNLNKTITAQNQAIKNIGIKNTSRCVGMVFSWLGFSLLIVALLCAILVGIIALSSSSWFPIKSIVSLAQSNKVLTMIISVIIFIGCIPLCFLIYNEIDLLKATIIDEKGKIDKFEKAIEGMQQEIIDCKNGIEMWKRKIPAIDEEQVVDKKLLAEQTDYQHKNIPLCNDAIHISKAMISTLELKSILDPRDWENLDLVIFYIETGRAESIKEALQLVDREKQTTAIINAVERASKEIQGTIQTSIARLGQLMTTCFSQLSSQMVRCFQEQNKLLLEQSTKLEGINASIQQSNEHLLEICSQEKIQNAFLSKISYNSLSLARDVQSMRYQGDIVFSHTPLQLS